MRFSLHAALHNEVAKQQAYCVGRSGVSEREEGALNELAECLSKNVLPGFLHLNADPDLDNLQGVGTFHNILASVKSG